MSASPNHYATGDHLWRVRDRAVQWSWGVAHNRYLAELALPEDDPARRFIEQLDDALGVIGEAFDEKFDQVDAEEVRS